MMPTQEFVAKWQDRDETDNFYQKYDAELVKDDLRPLVFEEIRLQVRALREVLLAWIGLHAILSFVL